MINGLRSKGKNTKRGSRGFNNKQPNFTRRISLASEWHRSLLLYDSLTTLADHSRTSEMQGSVAWIRKDSSYHPEADFGNAHQAASIVRQWSHLMSRKTVKDTTGCFSQGRRPEWWLSLSRGKINRNMGWRTTGGERRLHRVPRPRSPHRCGAAAKWLLALLSPGTDVNTTAHIMRKFAAGPQKVW